MDWCKQSLKDFSATVQAGSIIIMYTHETRWAEEHMVGLTHETSINQRVEAQPSNQKIDWLASAKHINQWKEHA